MLTAAILLSMVGCTKKKADNTVEVYCLNMDVTSSVPESYVLRSKNSDVDKQVDELLGRLQDKPEDSRLRKAIPDEVVVRGHEEKNYNCTVDFSKEYYDLTAAQEVLLRASVVRTLTQLDSISYVTFTVNSIPLVDSDDEIVGSMGADDFVENPGEQINTSVKETLTLYFADKDGTGLEKQTRVIHYSSNIALENQPGFQTLIKCKMYFTLKHFRTFLKVLLLVVVISHTPLGMNVLRLAWICLNLFTKTSDMHINRTHVPRVILAPYNL